jgi:hypothetical protein
MTSLAGTARGRSRQDKNMSPDRDAVQDALQASYQKITAVTARGAGR